MAIALSTLNKQAKHKGLIATREAMSQRLASSHQGISYLLNKHRSGHSVNFQRSFIRAVPSSAFLGQLTFPNQVASRLSKADGQTLDDHQISSPSSMRSLGSSMTSRNPNWIRQWGNVCFEKYLKTGFWGCQVFKS